MFLRVLTGPRVRKVSVTKKKVDGTLSGIVSVKLLAGPAGQARVQLAGKGPLLNPPATGTLVTDVIVQLLIDDGVSIGCFQVAFPVRAARERYCSSTPPSSKPKARDARTRLAALGRERCRPRKGCGARISNSAGSGDRVLSG
jgi:hypothetical protein